MEDHTLFLRITRGGATVTHSKILQLTFATLVANRAVQRVVDQQKLHHGLLGLDGFIALGADHHPLRHRRGAGRHGLGCFFNIHQAHAAARRDAQLLVVTKMRNEGANFFSCMHHHAAFIDFYLLTVEFDFNHMYSRDQACGALAAFEVCAIKASNSGLKCLSMARTGIAAASPNAQMVRP